MGACARRTAAASVLALAAGVAATHFATDGFQAFTLETARRLAALRVSAPLPGYALVLADGSSGSLADWRGKVVVVDFFYSRCDTICSALGGAFGHLQERLAPELASGDLVLVSLSFDLARDGPAELARYRSRHVRGAGWEVGRPTDAAALARWLDAFGVVVIPDGADGFVHNAAFHVVDPHGRLVAIRGIDELDRVVEEVRRALPGRTG
jgi:protein SCO1/2